MSVTPTRRSAFFAVAFTLAAWVLAVAPAQAQALPGGSYQRTCKQIHWAGTTLVAECLSADGRYTGTGLPNANKCSGDIGNNNGRLQCTYVGGAPSPGYGGPGYGGPGYGGPGYGPPPAPGYGPPGYSGYDDRRARCEQLWHREHELRDRLQYLPWGPERADVEHRLHDVYDDRERLGCRG